MFPNATVSSRSSSSRSGSCGRNSSMPSLRMQSPLAPRTSVNPLFRHTDAHAHAQFTSFDASHFMFRQHKMADRRKAYLRRYHSHDSQTNFVESSGESKDNSPDNTRDRGGRRSAPDSAVDSSPESTGNRGKDRTSAQEYEVRDFLDRYSLPRVVRVHTPNGPAVTEPLLLYRCFDNFTKVQARPIPPRKGKDKHDGRVLHFPEGYPGWFSLTSEKGDRCALLHNSLLQLVREQVCSFLSCASFTAYTAHAPDLGPGAVPGDPLTTRSTQYVRTVVRGGQVFRLRAVFQHRERPDAPGVGRHSTRSGRMSSRAARDRDLANRYAQLIDVNNQELYAPLTTKGEFYEVHSSTKARLCFPGMLDKTGPLALDKDCLYRLAHLLRRMHLPLKVKLMSGPLPPGLPKDFPDTFILDEKFQEPLLVTCSLPAPGDAIAHEINCLNISSKLKVSRSMLGFDSEYKLFKSQRLQSALSHCHKNVELWYRQVRLVPNFRTEVKHQPVAVSPAGELENCGRGAEVCPGCRRLKKSCGGRCEMAARGLRDEEVKRYTETNLERQLITKEVLEKFPKPKKWYRHFKILGNSNESSGDHLGGRLKDAQLDTCEKVRSIDRYKDMSKLIEEKFGAKKQYNPVKKSASFMFSTKRIDLEETPVRSKDPSLLKCQSLDTQLCLAEAKKPKKRGSDVSESFSHEFQMCILENERGFIDTPSSKSHGNSLKDLRSLNMIITEIDLDEIKPVKETVPDLIPSHQGENSFITDRLCSEFHVKTKIQKVKRTNPGSKSTKSVAEEHQKPGDNSLKTSESAKADQVHVVQVHSVVNRVQSRALPVVDDLPYSHVVDEVRRPSSARAISESENVYAEICDSKTRCDCGSGEKCTSGGKCKRKGADAEYCYVKLGSNGDSITQSSDDDIEAIYNTLR